MCSVSVSFVRVGSQISPRRAKKDSNIPSPGRTRSVKCPTPRPTKTIKSPPHALIYKNRVSKNFVISLNFPCLSLFPVLFAYVVFSWLFCGWVFCQCRSGCRQNFPNFYPTFSSVPLYTFFSSLAAILSLTQVTVFRNQCAPKAGFSAV